MSNGAVILPRNVLRFDVGAVPRHLIPQVAVVDGGRVLMPGGDLRGVRRRCALRARQELDRLASLRHPQAWRRFECELPMVELLDVAGGSLAVHPTLRSRAHRLECSYEWSVEEAERVWRDASVRLARTILEPQARDSSRQLRADSRLLLGASGFMHGEDLIDTLLQLSFRRACFEDGAAPRTPAEFEAALDAGRERLPAALEDLTRRAGEWFAQGRALRELLADPRVHDQAAQRESLAHLRRLFDAATLGAASADELGRLSVHVGAEKRRWQRRLARGAESAHVLREVLQWNARLAHVDAELAAQMRWLARRDELRNAIEEYRISLYAQELKTLGAVSAARLEARAAEIDAWLTR